MKLKMVYSGKEIKNVVFKPCPFCGNDTLIVTEEKTYNDLVEEHGSSMLRMECKVCDTEKRLFDIPNNNYWMGLGMLISNWNTRKGGDNNAD